jgi:hypothetical protein
MQTLPTLQQVLPAWAAHPGFRIEQRKLKEHHLESSLQVALPPH